MKLSDVLHIENVKVPLEAQDKEEVFEELVHLAARNGFVTDADAAIEALTEREAKATTGIGQGVAIPHGKHATVPRLTASLGTSPGGIEFDAVDGEPVHIVFLLLAEEGNPGPHVQALATIAKLLQNPRFRQELADAPTPEAAYEVLKKHENAPAS